MSDYTVRHLDEVPDVLGDYPGEMRFFRDQLGAEQVTFTHRRMPQGTGGRGGYGHRHFTQEEIVFVISGTLTFKLDDDVFEAGPGTAVRIGQGVLRSVHNDHPDDVHLLIISTQIEDLRGDSETVDGFWPAAQDEPS